MHRHDVATTTKTRDDDDNQGEDDDNDDGDEDDNEDWDDDTNTTPGHRDTTIRRDTMHNDDSRHSIDPSASPSRWKARAPNATPCAEAVATSDPRKRARLSCGKSPVESQ